ncbi:MAG: tRNA(Ile)(2)-agmatinylcytidine synthase [Nitrosopumilus sp.]|nr:tRNA(Ile)(2)-agmatinylcytidine synthase [Nitrosopumilus sp.]
MDSASILNIGFDDTDSPKGMCTTFLAYKIVDYLKKQDSEFLDFPRLIRFNPNIPWKTRGNGAVSLKIRTKNPSKIKNKIKNFVSRYSDTQNGANPGLVFYENKIIPSYFTEFSELALWQLINRNEAKKFAQKNDLEIFYKGNGQGLIGAIGAIGYQFYDYTLELLSYRRPSKFGKERKISSESVKTMQQKTFPYTFNSFDSKKSRVLITPHGPDPVFYGIRGEKVDSLLSATKILETDEKLAGHMIFKSNQGTDDHLKNTFTKSTMKPYSSGIITGTLSYTPKIKKGGHVFFSIKCNGDELQCAVYKPTGLSSIALALIPGDTIRVGGGIRKASKIHPRILNLEFIDIIDLKRNIVKSNPLCKKCNKKMKSKGQNQGYQCIKCGKVSKNKIVLEIPRKIKQQLYIPDVSAHRHLSRPLTRLGKINQKLKFDESFSWFCVYEN